MTKKLHPGQSQRRDAGFSLIELLVVLGILALLAGVVGPKVVGYFGRAKTQTAVTQIEGMRAALDLYLLDMGRYPTAEQGLDALVRAPANALTWNGPYLQDTDVPLDPWGQPYRYVVTQDGQVAIATLGADNQEGGSGEAADIRS
ncbi:MAG: type II secretion system major pseudopilin GspG [Pseudomonadota bacterium]